MWCLGEVQSSSQLWFSDGNPIADTRGGYGVSSRLIVDQQGFLDLTEIDVPNVTALDANGLSLWLIQDSEPHWLNLSLAIVGDGGFNLTDLNTSTASVSGRLKPLPEVSAEDANFINDMIAQNYVPYQNIPDAPGQTVEEIRTLGQRLFPFSPFSFQLAMCIYDWTTASFTRMVLLKIFQYTGITPPPFPIDNTSITEQIWASNWSTYTPQNPDFMHSFMMKPASTLQDLQAQFSDIATALHNFSDVENRLLSAAMQALPRTSMFSNLQLFSGQMDIYQLGFNHFGIEFLECPLNAGPVSQELIIAFADAVTSYISAGKTITTKMVWSFTDTVENAMHYANGILLVANFPGDSWVWESAAYITPLSDDLNKTEYTFMPGTQFEVQSVNQTTVEGKQVVVITLQPVPINAQAATRLEIPDEAKEAFPAMLKGGDAARLVEGYTPTGKLPHSPNKTGGRRCACYRHV